MTIHNKIKVMALLFTGIATITRGQNLDLKDLNIPNSPAFTVLDYSPKVIDKPGTSKAFTTSFVGLLTQPGGLPKNFSIEVAPFWFFKNKLNAYTYLGIDTATRKQTNIFCNLRNASFSIGSIFKDSTKALPFNANYFAAGVRLNLIKVARRGVPEEIFNTVSAIAGAQTAVLLNASQVCLEKLNPAASSLAINDCIGDFLKKDTVIPRLEKRLDKLLAAKPLFHLDVAFAGSWTFKDNALSNDHHYRSGIWTTMELNIPLTNSKNIDKLIENKNYLSLYGNVRYIKEDSTTNYIKFTRQKLLDIGGRLELELDRFSISFETVHRINQTNSQLNTSRNVGILQYKITDKLFLSGTFGKNFGNVNNLLALFGLNWGLGKESINNPLKN